MKKKGSRILALVLCVCMVLGMAPTLALAADEAATPEYIYFRGGTGTTSQTLDNGGYREVMYLYEMDSSATPGDANDANKESPVTQVTSLDAINPDRYYVIVGNGNPGQTTASVAVHLLGGPTIARLNAGSDRSTVGNIVNNSSYNNSTALFKITKNTDGKTYTITSAYARNESGASYSVAAPTTKGDAAVRLVNDGSSTPVYITASDENPGGFYLTFNAPGKDDQKFLSFGSNWDAGTTSYVMYLYHADSAGASPGTRTTTGVVSGDHYMLVAPTVTSGSPRAMHVTGTETNQCSSGTGETITHSCGTAHTFTITLEEGASAPGPYLIQSDNSSNYLTLKENSGGQLTLVADKANATRFYIVKSQFENTNGFFLTNVEPYYDVDPDASNFLAFDNSETHGWVSQSTPQLIYYYKLQGDLESATMQSEVVRADVIDRTDGMAYLIVSNEGYAMACIQEGGKYVTYCYEFPDPGAETATISSLRDVNGGHPLTDENVKTVLFTVTDENTEGEGEATNLQYHTASAMYPEQHMALTNATGINNRKALEFTTDEGHSPLFITPAANLHGFYVSLAEFQTATFDDAPNTQFDAVKYLTFGNGTGVGWAAGSVPFPMYLYEMPERSNGTWDTSGVATLTTEPESGHYYLIVSSRSSYTGTSDGQPRYMHGWLNSGTYRADYCAPAAAGDKTLPLSAAHNTGAHVFYFTASGEELDQFLIESYNVPDYYLTMDTARGTTTLSLNNNPKNHVRFYVTPSERHTGAVYITVGGEGADAPVTISEMFDSSPDNTWVFTGGADVAGGFAQTGGKRNYVGHFEEYIRYNAADNTNNQLQRYTINTGKDGQTLANVVTNFATRVSNYNPRAVVYLVTSADTADENFATNLESFLNSCLALRNSESLVVLQTLDSTVTEKVNEAVETYTAKEENSGKSSRITVVEHTLEEGTGLTDGVLNSDGHRIIATQLAEALLGTELDEAAFPYIRSGNGSHLVTTTVAAPSTYSGTAPVVTTTDGFQVTVAEEVTNWTYTLTLSNGVVINGSVTDSSTTTIPGVPTGATYRLTVLTDGGTNQLPTVDTLAKTSPYAEAQEGIQNLLSAKESGQITWLFMGDSITHGAAWTLGHDSISQTFEKYLHDVMGRTDDVVVNTAVSGATTNGTKSTISNIQYRLTQYEDAVPDVVSIMLGTNDFGNTDQATYRANMETIIKAIRGGDEVEGVNPDAFIILRCPTYATSRKGIDERYGTVLKEIADADTTHHTIYIDQYTPIADVADSTYTWITNTQLFYGNNLHPGPLGQLIMARQFIRALGLWNWDNAIANLDYEVNFQTAENGGVDVGDYVSIDPASDSITLNITNLNTAYEGGTLGHTTLTATKDGVSYTITVPAGSESVTLTNLPHEEYNVTVSSVLTGSAAKRVTFDAVQKTLKSSDKSIKSITVNGAEVRTPWGNESWTLELAENSNYPEVNDIVVTPNDSNAKAEVTKGEGNGVFTITVTAEDGTSEEHTLRVTIYSHEHKWGSVKFWWRGSSRDDSADKDEWLTKDFDYYVEHVDAIASATRVCTAADEEDWETKTKQTATTAVEITAQQAPTCEAGGTLTVSVTATFDGDPNGHTADHTFTFDAIGHNWSSTVTWGEWTGNDKDGWTITAKKICANEENHYLEGQVNVSVETTPAECSKAGETVYSATATFDGDGETYNAPNTKVVPISQLGHDWNDPVFVWAADHSSATASRTCKRNDTHIEQAQKVEVNSTTTEAACEKAGETVYTATATFLNDSNEYKDEQKVAIPALEHDWNKPVFNWAEDNSSATATRTCKNDTNNEHAQTVDAVITSETTLEPSCEDEGTATLTATAKFGEDEKDTFSEDKENVTLPAAGHKTELVQAKPSTTTEKGNLEHYKCSVCEKLFWDQEAKQPITNPDDVLLDLADHDNHVWTKFVFTWHEDGMNTTATLTGSECSEGSEEKPCTQSESVAATMTWDEESLQEATCEEDGSVTFTATATLGGAEKAEDHEVILAALGHTLELVEAKAPTCEDEGNDAYYQCSVCGDLFDGDQETPLDEIPTIDALGHDWGEPVFNWTKTADGYTAAATFTCGNDGDHVETVDATVTSEETKAPTATEKGTMTYTATVNFDGKDYSATKDEDIPATGTPEVPSDDATISGITVAGVAAEKGEDGTWSVKLPYGSELPGAEDIAVDAAEGATCEVVDNGDGTYTITVTAEDKTTTAIYTLSVTIAEKEPEPEVPSDDATISGITVSGKKAAKNSDGTWSVKLPYGSELPGAEDIAVDAAEGATCEVVDNGDGTYTITVTAEDKTTTATYTLNVTVAEKPANTPTKPKTESTPETPDTTTTTETSSDGVTGTTTKDKDGNTTGIEVVVPEDAADSDGVLTAPVEVEVADSVDEAPEIDVTVKGGGSAKVKIPVTNVTPGTVAVVVDEDGNETILRDSIVTEDGVLLEVENGAKIKIVDNTKEFEDIDNVPWAKDAIISTVARELFHGTTETTFSPDLNTDRGMVVTLLHRMEYEPDFGSSDFIDVANSSWYADAVAWGQSTGVVKGYSDEAFGPNDAVTREQLAVMLYNYAAFTGMDTTARGDLSAFTDGAATSDWAAEAMEWAIGTGLMVGFGDGTLGADGYATRAQVAVVIQRFCELRFA